MKYILSRFGGEYKPSKSLNQIFAYPTEYRERLQELDLPLSGEIEIPDLALITIAKEISGERKEVGIFLEAVDIDESQVSSCDVDFFMGDKNLVYALRTTAIEECGPIYSGDLEMAISNGVVGNFKNFQVSEFKTMRRPVYNSALDEQVVKPSIIIPPKSVYNHFIFGLGRYD